MIEADYIKAMAAKEAQHYPLLCNVVSVDWPARTCELQPLIAIPNFPDARLQASVKLTGGMAMKPVIQSQVLAMVWSGVNATVIAWGELEHIDLTDCTLTVKAGQHSLGEILQNLVETTNSIAGDVQKITVNCTAPGTPSGLPLNAPAFIQHQTALAKIKQQLKSIFT